MAGERPSFLSIWFSSCQIDVPRPGARYREKKKHLACRTRSSSRFISASVAGVAGWPRMMARPFANSGSASKEYDWSRLKDSTDWAIFVEDVSSRNDTKGYSGELECGGEWGGEGMTEVRMMRVDHERDHWEIRLLIRCHSLLVPGYQKIHFHSRAFFS